MKHILKNSDRKRFLLLKFFYHGLGQKIQIFGDGILIEVAILDRNSLYIEIPVIGYNNIVFECPDGVLCFSCFDDDIQIKCPLRKSIINEVDIYYSEIPVVVLISNKNYESWLLRILESLYINCSVEFKLCLIIDGELSNGVIKTLGEYNPHIINITSEPNSLGAKMILYKIDQVVHAPYYIYLDSDMLVVNNIDYLFSIGSVLDNQIAICREQKVFNNLYYCCNSGNYPYYGVKDIDLNLLESRNNIIINTGLMIFDKQAMSILRNNILQDIDKYTTWDSLGCNRGIYWREQAIVNIALSAMDIIVLDSKFNYQMLQNEVRDIPEDIKIFHFNGQPGKNKLSEIIDLKK